MGFNNWISGIGFNSVCKNLSEKDIKATPGLLAFANYVDNITRYWNIKPIVNVKMLILKISVFLVIIGLLINMVVDLINWILDCFGLGCNIATVDSWKDGYSTFMKYINMIVLAISYILTIAIGIHIFNVISILLKEGKNCMVLNTIVITIEKLLIYLFPLIIIASLINSSARGLAPPSDNICDIKNNKDEFDLGVPDFIRQYGSYIFIPLVIFGIIYFLFFNCYTHTFFKDSFKILQLSSIANLIVISLSILISILVFGFIYSTYSSVLLSSYGLNFNYIVLLVLSIILYLIILKRPLAYASVVSSSTGFLHQFFPQICNVDDSKNKQMSPLVRFLNLNK